MHSTLQNQSIWAKPGPPQYCFSFQFNRIICHFTATNIYAVTQILYSHSKTFCPELQAFCGIR